MMRWGRKKPVLSGSSSSSSSASSSSSSGLSRALPVSWFSKFSGISVGGGADLKPVKDKKQNEEVSKNISAKSSTKRLEAIHESSNRVLLRKENTICELDSLATGIHTKNGARSTDMESNEKFEEIMKNVRKKVRDFQRETGRFLDVEAMDGEKGTVIMTPRLKLNREKQRFDRRDQKLLEQKQQRIKERDAEMKETKPARRTATVQSLESVQEPVHQWQKLKEIKLREVKLKADQQRKSLYIRRELKENNKVRVFSPRGSSRAEKCRVKAIEDMKKAKLRAREHELVTGMENESFAVVKCSSDPQKDFRDSMIEMIMENGIKNPEELKELLICYLRLNTDEYHDMIIKVFQQVHNDLNCDAEK